MYEYNLKLYSAYNFCEENMGKPLSILKFKQMRDISPYNALLYFAMNGDLNIPEAENRLNPTRIYLCDVFLQTEDVLLYNVSFRTTNEMRYIIEIESAMNPFKIPDINRSSKERCKHIESVIFKTFSLEGDVVRFELPPIEEHVPSYFSSLRVAKTVLFTFEEWLSLGRDKDGKLNLPNSFTVDERIAIRSVASKHLFRFEEAIKTSFNRL